MPENIPVLVPRYETEVTYPNSRTPAWKVQAEYYEGLARSFFIAAPLIAIEPDMEICGKNLRAYYKDHILRSCTPGDEQYVLSYSDMDRDAAPSFGLHTYQQTVETCAIVIGSDWSRRRRRSGTPTAGRRRTGSPRSSATTPKAPPRRRTGDCSTCSTWRSST